MRICLEYRLGAHGAAIQMHSRVVRVVHQTLRASRIPGMAVAFEEIVAPAGRKQLDEFVEDQLCGASHELPADWYGVDENGMHILRLPTEDDQTRRVHEERLTEGRTLPAQSTQSDDVLRRFTRPNERRRNPRFPVHVEVSYYVGDIPYLGSVLNISQSSLFMQTDHEIPPVGTAVSLKFPLAEAPDPQYVRIDGTVCRHWDRSGEILPGFAVHFDHVGELGRRGIFQMYLNNFRKRASRPRPRRGYHYSMRKR